MNNKAFTLLLVAFLALLSLAANGCAATTVLSSPDPSPTEAASPPIASTPTPAAQSASPTPPAPHTSNGSQPPSTGRWIDVDVSRFVVRLMDGTSVQQEIAPVAVGAQVDTGAFESTQTGLFHVYEKDADLVYDAPYHTYINDWVGFDPDKANGFHSFLKDQAGQVVDASTGRVSNGCVRTGAPDAVFAFAQLGMPVYVHY